MRIDSSSAGLVLSQCQRTRSPGFARPWSSSRRSVAKKITDGVQVQEAVKVIGRLWESVSVCGIDTDKLLVALF